jgi:hypothetical protein
MPPKLDDLPTIRLADIGEPIPEADTAQGFALALERIRESRAAGILLSLWVWIKVIAVLAALVVAGVLLSSNVDAWLPHATMAAIKLFTGMDEVKARIAPPALPPGAVEAVSPQLPQLSPATIEQIMAPSAPRTLEPIEVFRRAFQAVSRSRAKLAAADAAELDAILSGLGAELDESEGPRLNEYLARLRSQGDTVSYEEQEAVWLTARAVRRLTPERQGRLQELFAQAVALGVEAGAPPAGPGPTVAQPNP